MRSDSTVISHVVLFVYQIMLNNSTRNTVTNTVIFLSKLSNWRRVCFDYISLTLQDHQRL